MAERCCAAEVVPGRRRHTGAVKFPATLPIPKGVLTIARRLEDAGYETWCVGGAVRDNLLSYPSKDFDLATAATPDVVRQLFTRTIPIGVEHGTVAVLDRRRQPHEVTTFRRDVRTDGRHAVVEFGVSLDDDLARRDFTLNAVAYHPFTHEWRDPFGGSEDMEARIIRGVGDPHRRIKEDFLRILRALRFAARFRFSIEPATYEAAHAQIGGLRTLSAERVRDEWFRGLGTAQAVSEFVGLWDEIGARAIWLPEIPEGVKTAVGLDRLARDPVLITSYLSADPARTLERLRCSRVQIERGRRLGEYVTSRPDAADAAAVRRWLAATGPPLADDLLALDAAVGEGEALAQSVRRVRAGKPALTVGDLAIDGHVLKTLGVAEGPAIGRILATLLDEVLDDPTRNDPGRLAARVRRLLQASPGGGTDPGL
jgi:tRNA nucleotidyltransferase (CCA-adding enzyme)